jgi:histidyl-tRNA synthetase
MKNQKLPYKRYQIGPVFRDEPITANRFRQFTQCDADVIGSTIRDEAEVLTLAVNILNNLGIKPVVLINNRKLLNEILNDAGVKEKNKSQVLREIDKYGKLSEKEIKKRLKKYKAENVLDSFKKGEKFFKQFESYKEIIGLMSYCRAFGIKVLFSPTIVRGLSYYNGSVFELKAKGMKDSIVAGGSYMFEKVQSTGISFGLDRIAAIVNIKEKKEKYLVVSLNQDRQAIKLAQKLRKQGKIVSLFYGKPSKALEYANSYKINKVVFVGSKELKKKLFKIKDMKTGKEKKMK